MAIQNISRILRIDRVICIISELVLGNVAQGSNSKKKKNEGAVCGSAIRRDFFEIQFRESEHVFYFTCKNSFITSEN